MALPSLLKQASAEENDPRLNFYDYSQEVLAVLLEDRYQLDTYRTKQLFDWVYSKSVTDFAQMTNLAIDLRDKLANDFVFPEAELVNKQVSQDGTKKYLFKVPSGKSVETVLIKQDNRHTLCVSSQYGCGMDCKFCKTGTMGFIANLKTSDIIAQVLGVFKDCEARQDVFQSIVFMGMGEPLHNFKGVTEALKILIDPVGIAIPPRKITVSSVGLVPAIKKFAKLDLGVNLAVSLNATDNVTRSKIMPINDRFDIAELIETLKEFPLASKRKKITIEYVMLDGVNTRQEDLERLPRILKGLQCRVNLIPYNDNAGMGFKPPKEKLIYDWLKYLMRYKIDTTVRWSKGKDINAACGQLVTEAIKKK